MENIYSKDTKGLKDVKRRALGKKLSVDSAFILNAIWQAKKKEVNSLKRKNDGRHCYTKK